MPSTIATSNPTLVVAAEGGGGGGGGGSHACATYRFVLADRMTAVELADISEIAFDTRGTYRLNRPNVWGFRVPCDNPLVNTVYSDGYPYLKSGLRCLKVYRTPGGGGSERLIFNGRVWRVDRVGDENNAYATVTCVDPMILWKRRVVRDASGNFITPDFSTGGTFTEISGAELIRQAVQYSILYEAQHAGLPGPPFADLDLQWTLAGPSEPSLVGTFEDGVDLSFIMQSPMPLFIEELARMITNTGMTDIHIDPIDGEQNMLGQLHAEIQYGNDVSSTVHFDYATGIYNVKHARHTDDMDNIANRIWYNLGPRFTDMPNRYRGGNITGDAPFFNPDHANYGGAPGGDSDEDGTAPPFAATNTLGEAIHDSRELYGVFMDVRAYDVEDENTHGGEADDGTEPFVIPNTRKLYYRLWQTESLLRVKPREFLGMTPVPCGEFTPFDDYYLGDVVTVNTGSQLGVQIENAQQRIYGFDIEPDINNVERVGELIASQDGES